MKRLLISAFAIAALSAGPAWAQSSDHRDPKDKNTHTQSDQDHSGNNSGGAGDHGGASGGPHGGAPGGSHGGTSGGPPGGGSTDHTATTGGHQDRGGTSGGPPGGGSTDHTTTTSSHQDHGGNTGGASRGSSDHTMTTGGTHRMPHGTAPRMHRPSNWNQHPRTFDSHTYQRNVTAPRRFHWHSYQRPHGWYDHRWVFGDIMPRFFWAQNYWITDWWAFDLMPPPYGYEWVQYGDDALLVNTDTGQVLTVEYNLFD